MSVQKIKLSKTFQEICVKIGECKSREEEEQIVTKWMVTVKKDLGKSKLAISKKYEGVVSLIHLTLLGYDTAFGQIHAVNLTQESQMMTKALGYLSCSALLDSQSSLLILIINSTQRDLSSQHPTSMALALTAVCNLVTADLIPSVIGYIGQCLVHSIPMVREKAVMCVHSFIQKDPSCVVEFFPELIRLLGDPDLSIVNAVINTFSCLLKNTLNIRQIADAVPDVCNIANIIQAGQAKIEYYHQRLQAPFILVNIFTLFQRLAPHMPELGEMALPILQYSLITYTLDGSAMASVLYEAIKTCIVLGVTDIEPMRGAVGQFMQSNDDNYKLVGLGLLQSVPELADGFQGVIIDALEHPDATMRLKTLALLHAMANEGNAQIIVVNMLKFFQRTNNERIRTELADRITSVASQYSPSPLWFAKTMEQLFALGGEHVKPEVAFAVLKVITENCDEDMRRGIVNLYIDVAQSGKRLSDVFVIVIARVIGSYAELSDEYDLDFVALLLCDLADRYEAPRDWVLNAMLEIVSKLEEVPHEVSDVFENYKQSKSIIVQEICFEALSILNYKDALMVAVENEVPEDFDNQMMFLDDFVADAIENKGMKDYVPLDERDQDTLTPKATLKFTYTGDTTGQTYGAEASKDIDGLPRVIDEPAVEAGLNVTGVKSIWGDSGLEPVADVDGPAASQGWSSAQTTAAPEQPVSIFQKLAIKKGATTTDDTRKEKMKGSLFGGMKKAAPAKKPGQAPSMSVTEMSAAPVAAVSAPAAAPVAPQSLTEEDHRMLERVQSQINMPAPTPIQAFSQTGEGTPVFEDGQVKITAFAHDGSVLLGIMNSSRHAPVMRFSLETSGPAVFEREVIMHPANVSSIPPAQIIWHLTTFKFPTQVRGFPDFKFKATIIYNGNSPATFDLPMDMTTFVVPTNSKTEEFGALWKQGGSEIVYTMKSTGDVTMDEISQAMNDMVHVKTVQRIGTEEIFMGTLFSTPLRVLVHVKFGADKIDMKVLTKAPPLTQALVKTLQEIFG